MDLGFYNSYNSIKLNILTADICFSQSPSVGIDFVLL